MIGVSGAESAATGVAAVVIGVMFAVGAVVAVVVVAGGGSGGAIGFGKSNEGSALGDGVGIEAASDFVDLTSASSTAERAAAGCGVVAG